MIVSFKRIVLLGLIVVFSFMGRAENLVINRGERVIVFAPHPDDEILGCAGVIQKVLEKNGNVWVVYLTNGDHNQLAYMAYKKEILLRPADYINLGKMRRKESTIATEILGINKKNLIFLGYPDFGTLKIWEDYWGEKTKPFESLLTRAKYVPYKENYSYGKPYIGDSIVSDIEDIILKIKPTKIFTTGSYDKNKDHRALYNFLRAALLNIKSKVQPEVLVYLIHYNRWPSPLDYRPNFSLIPPGSLLNLKWFVLPLEEAEVNKKYSSIKCFKSQMVLKKKWFFSFVRKNELFYRESAGEIKKGNILKYESEKEYEIKDKKRISIPYEIFLKGEKDGIEINLIQKKRFLKPINYIFYFYGWSNNISFSDMPKIKVSLRKKREILRMKDSTIYYGLKYRKDKRMVVFKIKWAALGRPEYMFFSTEVKTGGITYDFIPWQLIKVLYKF